MNSLYNLAVIISVVDKFTGPVQRMVQNLAKFESNIEKAKNIVDIGNRMAVSGALVQGAADKIKGSLLNVLTPTMENQKALGELASLGIKNLNAIAGAATQFSKKWAGTTEDQFISAAYDIKSGIASLSDEAVGQFTAMAALTAKATKATTAEMTSLFATGYGIYKDLYSNLSDFQFGEMFSAGIAAAVQQFKTTGSGMAQALTTLGAAASTAKRPFEEQLAVLGMLQATMPGGEAATKYKSFVQNAAKAGSELGLSFVDSNNQLLGMADILDKLRGKYGETLDAIEKQQIQKAFGTEEAVALIDLLYGKVGALRSNVDTLGMSIRQGTAFTEGMARAMNTGVGAEFEKLAQNLKILKREIGDELAPLIKAFTPTVQGWVESFQGMAKSHPTLVRTALLIMSISAVAFMVLAPLLMIGSGFVMLTGYVIWGLQKIGQGFIWTKGQLLKLGTVSRFAFNLLQLAVSRAAPFLSRLAVQILLFAWAAGVKTYLAIRALASGLLQFGAAAIRTAAAALPGLIAAVWSFTAALLANPITWIVLAVAALGAAIYLLWRRWDVVVAALGRGWEWLKGLFAGAVEWFAGIFQGIVATAQQYGPMILAALFPVIGIPLLIAQHWSTIKDIAAEIFNSLVQFIPQKISEIIFAIQAKGAEFLASGRALIDSFVQGIQSVISRPAEVVQEGLANLRRLLPFSDAKEGPLSTLTRSGVAFVETFAGGILSRSGLLKTATAAVMAGAALAAPVSPAVAMPAIPAVEQQIRLNPVIGDIPALSADLEMNPGRVLSRTPRVSLREFVRETFSEKETTRETRRPVVLLVNGGQAAGGSVDDLLDLAYQYLSMHG